MRGTRRTGLLALTLGALGCPGAGELQPFGLASQTETERPPETETDAGTTDAAPTSGPATSTTGEPAPEWDGSIGLVYVRCPRTTASIEISGDVILDGETVPVTRTLSYFDVVDRLPISSGRPVDQMLAPCDLVHRDASGSEELLFDCTSLSDDEQACAAVAPAVSFDGRRIAFAVHRGTITHEDNQVTPNRLHPDAEGGDSYFRPLPNPILEGVEAQLHIVDLDTGAVTALPHSPGTFDTHPTFLPGGRLVFASTLAATRGTEVRSVGADIWNSNVTANPALHLYVMDEGGQNRYRLSHQGLTAELHPLVLRDGRIAMASWQPYGMSPYRDQNTPGQQAAVDSLFHLVTTSSRGSLLSPLFGHHTYNAPGAIDHFASTRATQAPDGTLWFGDGGGVSGSGALYGLVPRQDGVEGPGPDEADSATVFSPLELRQAATWAESRYNFSEVITGEPVMLEHYDDPLVFRGSLRDPEALPDGTLLVTWAKGGCSVTSSQEDTLIDQGLLDPDDAEQGLTGEYTFTPMVMMTVLGLDTPGCDAGIHRITAVPSTDPGDLEPVVDTREYHELMPRAVLPYSALHGVAEPATHPALSGPVPDHQQPEPGEPFGVLGGSSLIQRQTRSVDGHPFGSRVQWALQGTDTSLYDDDEICGLRVLALQPNDSDEQGSLFHVGGNRTMVLGEVPVRKRDPDGTILVDGRGDPDTSFRLSLPADTPLLLQGIDCDGRALNASQTPIAVRGGDNASCSGCHQRSEPGLPFDQTAAFLEDYVVVPLGRGTVPLMRGGDPYAVQIEEAAGFGLTYEFERDVMPILESRCLPCHAGDAPDGGLRLDLPGTDVGSTWWRLAADYRQGYVPTEQWAPGATDSKGVETGYLFTPQLSRYVRFMSARGSLLYWKAANARTDGYADGDRPATGGPMVADVDMGADHPTSITADELAVIARWIDTGAGAGSRMLADVTPPVVHAVADLSATPPRLHVGTFDLGRGVDPNSLEVCRLVLGGGCQDIDAPPASQAGRVTVSVPDVGEQSELRVTVRDFAGNVATVQRTMGSLATEPGGTPLGQDADGETAGADGGKPLRWLEDEGCNCRSTRPRPPAALIGLLLMLGALRPREARRHPLKRRRHRGPRPPAMS